MREKFDFLWSVLEILSVVCTPPVHADKRSCGGRRVPTCWKLHRVRAKAKNANYNAITPQA